MSTEIFNKNRVYEILVSIPRGKVITYGKIAEMLGNKALARAVGNALHQNTDGELYPCYKVVNSNGRLSSAYAFGGIDEQKRKLEREGITVIDYKVDISKFSV